MNLYPAKQLLNTTFLIRVHGEGVLQLLFIIRQWGFWKVMGDFLLMANLWTELLFVSFGLYVLRWVRKIDVRVVWSELMFVSLMTILTPFSHSRFLIQFNTSPLTYSRWISMYKKVIYHSLTILPHSLQPKKNFPSCCSATIEVRLGMLQQAARLFSGR